MLSHTEQAGSVQKVIPDSKENKSLCHGQKIPLELFCATIHTIQKEITVILRNVPFFLLKLPI